MAEGPSCPLHPGKMLKKLKWRLCDLLCLENHFSTEEHQSDCSCQLMNLQDVVLSGYLEGSTPLLMACQKGNLESVKRIVEHWGVSVNSTAAFYYRCKLRYYNKEQTRKISGATPLFVAAYSGHFFVVRYLIEMGADLSLKSEEDIRKCNPLAGLTALHGSLYSSEAEQKAIICYILSKVPATSLDGP